MARHRNVRTMNIDDEFYEDDSVFGHSVPDDDYCISPATAAQFTFNRDKRTDLSTYMGREEIPEEPGEGSDSDNPDHLGDSRDYSRPKLSEANEARLNSCLEEIRSILGDAYPDHVLIDTILKHDYNTQLSLDSILSLQDAPKPQREPRQNRRTRSQGDDDSGSSDGSDKECGRNEDTTLSNLSQGVHKYGGGLKTSKENNIIVEGNENRIETKKILGIEAVVAIPNNQTDSKITNQNQQIFHFESPLQLLKKAVESKEQSPQAVPSDLPKLLPKSNSAAEGVPSPTRFTMMTSVMGNPHGNSQGISLAALANQNLGKMALASTSGTGENRRTEIGQKVGGISLAQLARQREKNVPAASAKQTIMSSGLSLSDLANRHSSPPLCSLESSVNIAFRPGPFHDAESSKTIVENLDKRSISSSISSDIPLKIAKLSLADLANQHTGKSAPAMSTTLTDAKAGGACTPARMAVEHIPVPDDSKCLVQKKQKHEKVSTFSEIAMVHGETANSQQTGQSSNLKRERKSGEMGHDGSKTVGSISLGELAQQHSKEGPKPSIDLTKALASVKTSGKTDLAPVEDISDRDKPPVEPDPDGQTGVIDKVVPHDVDIEGINVGMANVCVKEYQADPSPFCAVLSTQVQGPKTKRHLRFRSFSYQMQQLQAKSIGKANMTNVHLDQCLLQNTLEPFHFDTPSPDDVVKEKQKQAFSGHSRQMKT